LSSQRRPGSISATGTGRSLSTGRPKAGLGGRSGEASGTGVNRLKDGAPDQHRNDDKIDEGHLDFVGWPSVAD
jgi:hypothetical protein